MINILLLNPISNAWCDVGKTAPQGSEEGERSEPHRTDRGQGHGH
jgi:hypothetical protein